MVWRPQELPSVRAFLLVFGCPNSPKEKHVETFHEVFLLSEQNYQASLTWSLFKTPGYLIGMFPSAATILTGGLWNTEAVGMKQLPKI